MFTIGKYYYVYNESNLVKITDLDSVGQSIDYGLRENEIIGLLEKVNDNQLVGLRLEIDNEGAALKIVLFQSDLNFNRLRILAEYDGIYFCVYSVKVHDNKIYISIFDRDRKKYLLKIMDVKKG